MIPFSVKNYGSSTFRQAFKLKFSYPLSSKVTYEGYDNTLGKAAFPQTDTVLTTNNDVFTLLGGVYPCIALHDTTKAAPAATNWFPTTPNSNTSSLNFLKGITYYVTQHGATIVANGSILFNMQMRIPATTETNSSMGFDLLFRYSFTSTTPVLTFYANEGNIAVPGAGATWTSFVSDTNGIVHTHAGITAGGAYLANIPAAPAAPEKTLAGWIVASL